MSILSQAIRIKRKKVISLILLVFIIFLFFQNFKFDDEYIRYPNSINQTKENLSESASWILNPFVIDDNDGTGDYTWATAVQEDWCKGAGTWGDPYIIENVTIDGNGLYSCLTVRDSNVPFTIKNCIFFNQTDYNYQLGGIDLENVNNSQIINNNCSNNHLGIHLQSSYNNTIVENYVKNDKFSGPHAGIWLEDSSENNSIIGNYVNNLHHKGYGIIIGYKCNNNTVFGNTLTNNEDDGIYVSSASYNRILLNDATNSNIGINSDDFTPSYSNNNNTMVGNFLFNNTIGASFEDTFNTTFTGNIVHNNTQTGVSLSSVECKDNILYNNSFFGNIIAHANDNGNDNKWDNGIIGNFWDDYTNGGGVDTTPFDGIGDINYTIPGTAKANDTKPIFENPIHNGEKIHIDGNGINGLNWSQTALVKWWCTGLGKLSDPYLIKNLKIDAGDSGSCIYIENTREYFEVENCTNYNSGIGMYGAGFTLFNVTNGLILNNNCSMNKGHGIYLDNWGTGLYDNITIKNNILNNNSYGIFIYNLDFSNIINNTAFNNTHVGIYLCGIEQSNITENKVMFNKDNGFEFFRNKNLSVSRNKAKNNDLNGIYFEDNVNDSIFLKNEIYNNKANGIEIDKTEDYGNGNNTFYNNNVTGNSQKGVYITNVANRYNLFYNNYFIGNGLHVQDDGSNNNWNNSLIGNYWDNYTELGSEARDSNDDGIGDFPYPISGTAKSKDYLPIWDDGDDLNPYIMINSPSFNEIFGIIAPSFNISINESNLDSMWYTIDNGLTNITFNEFTGVIDQREWDKKGIGPIILTFCANDTFGKIGFQSVSIEKEYDYWTLDPIIIDDLGNGDYTWAEAVLKGWCSGSGISGDPYIIEHIKIGGQDSSNCIEIQNSDAYFIIRNSMFYEASNGIYDASIKLNSVSNGVINNNNCSYNNANGITLVNCQDIDITENLINQNGRSGIVLINSDNIDIENNEETINHNNLYGIHLDNSHYNNITNNTVSYNQIGIFLNESNYNIISKNDLRYNDKAYEEIDCAGNQFNENIGVTLPRKGLPIDIIIIIIVVSIITVVIVTGVIAWRKKASITEEEKKEKINKKKLKLQNKIQKKMLEIGDIILENKFETALMNLIELKEKAQVHEIEDLVLDLEEKIKECKKSELNFINSLKKTIINLGKKFSRLQLAEIIESSGIKDEKLIEGVIQKMIHNKEIIAEYFSSTKSVVFEVVPSLEFIPEIFKEFNVFLSYSTLDSEYFQLPKVVKSLEKYPEINKVLYWEVDSGENIVEYMERTLKECNVFVLFCSENALNSKAVNDEWQAAFQLRKKGLLKIVPVYENESFVPALLTPLLNVKFSSGEFNIFINKLYTEILRE